MDAADLYITFAENDGVFGEVTNAVPSRSLAEIPAALRCGGLVGSVGLLQKL